MHGESCHMKAPDSSGKRLAYRKGQIEGADHGDGPHWTYTVDKTPVFPHIAAEVLGGNAVEGPRSRTTGDSMAGDVDWVRGRARRGA